MLRRAAGKPTPSRAPSISSFSIPSPADRSTATASPRTIESASDDILRVEEGSLYPALHRMEHLGWIVAGLANDVEQPARTRLQADSCRAAASGSRAGQGGIELTKGVGKVLRFACQERADGMDATSAR